LLNCAIVVVLLNKNEKKQKKRQKLELLTYTASVYQWKGIGVDEV